MTRTQRSGDGRLGQLAVGVVLAVFAWSWYDTTFNKPMTPYCAYLLDAHPIGLDASLDSSSLDTVMRCRVDKLRYGQKDWPVPACTEGDISFAKSHPNLSGRLCK